MPHQGQKFQAPLHFSLHTKQFFGGKSEPKGNFHLNCSLPSLTEKEPSFLAEAIFWPMRFRLGKRKKCEFEPREPGIPAKTGFITDKSFFVSAVSWSALSGE